MEKIAVSCSTGDEWKKVLNKAEKMGYHWGGQSFQGFIRDYSFADLRYLNISDKRLRRGSLSDCDGFTIISASDYLAYGLEGKPEFEVGDEVEVIEINDYFAHKVLLGARGYVKDILERSDCIRVNWDDGTSSAIFPKRLKLIKKGSDMKKHTIPLRVDDKVRVVQGSVYFNVHDIGVITYIESTNYNPLATITVGSINELINIKKLELIPTEADITVGSVWEKKEETINSWVNSKIRTVSVANDGDIQTKEEGCWGQPEQILADFKLIHRGDGEISADNFPDDFLDAMKFKVAVSDELNDMPIYGEAITELLKKQTNKKEKKMKREEMEIKKGMPVWDEACKNTGKVVAVYPTSNQASYLDDQSGEVETVDMGRLHYKAKLVLPKPKPVKKKTKKTTKKKAKKVNK